MSQLSFLAIAQNGKKLKCEKFLEEMKTVIPWSDLCEAIQPHYSPAATGRPLKDLDLMLKIHCLQQWYHLSDPEVEEAIYDRNSFQKFLGLNLIADGVPNEITILNFRHLLEEYNLGIMIFTKIETYLSEKGLRITDSTIVDEKSGLAHTIESIMARECDKSRFEKLLYGKLISSRNDDQQT